MRYQLLIRDLNFINRLWKLAVKFTFTPINLHLSENEGRCIQWNIWDTNTHIRNKSRSTALYKNLQTSAKSTDHSLRRFRQFYSQELIASARKISGTRARIYYGIIAFRPSFLVRTVTRTHRPIMNLGGEKLPHRDVLVD